MTILAYAVVSPATARTLATEPITSVGEITDLPPPGQNPELFTATQNLIERYGVDGVVFSDKKLHPGRDIKAGEAKIILASVFSRAALLGEHVASGYAKDPAKAAKIKAGMKAALAPSRACGILADTPHMAGIAKKPKAFPAGSVLTRKNILDCLPGSGSAPVPGSEIKATIARAEMIVQIDAAMDRVMEKLQAM